MNFQETKLLLIQNGQDALLRAFDGFDEDEKRAFCRQVNSIDWSIFDKRSEERKGGLSPISGLTRREIAERSDEFERTGAELLRAGKVGAVMLAGGQGTRLGSDAPKGAFNIGLTKEIYIFECLIDNLLSVTNKFGARVPLFVMTSDKNDIETRTFFEKHGYFGYPENDVYFFVQDMAPCTDFDGKVLLEEKAKIALSPNGNGGWFSSMKRAGLVGRLKKQGVEWLNVFAVDNVLQRIADPVFVGAAALSGLPCGAKAVKKVSPEERVGVLCQRGGRPDIIEYYELDEKTANARDEKGELLYGSGVILNYLFRVSSLEEIEGSKFPVHRVKKKVPYFDGEKRVIPDRENAYKYETLILDMIHLLNGCLPFEVEREKEFAPVKNASGADSIQTAQELLRKNGVQL